MEIATARFRLCGGNYFCYKLKSSNDGNARNCIAAKTPKTNPKIKGSLWDIWPSVLNRGGQVVRLWLRHEVIRHNGQFPALAAVVCSGANALKSQQPVPMVAAVVGRSIVFETGPRHGRGSFLASGRAAIAARGAQKQNRIR